ncbi:MAG: hypothetical protein SO135_02600 [Sphaerochaetaceae bacterium]|jgi:hypothetical protein|nr:hypothetical protein [Sphaerochaetaceae bacterium]NLY07092.1 hypothetical protein [Spirochaetales bacterium]
MKKLKMVFLVAVISCMLVFAVSQEQDWFDFSVGISFALRDGSLGALKDIKDFSAKDLKFGLEARTKLLFLEFDISGNLSATDKNDLKFSGLMVAGISEDLFGVARLGLCLGPVIDYVHDGQRGTLIIDGSPISEVSFSDALNKSHFHLRGTLDFLLGPVIKLGAAVSVPTDFTLEKHDLNSLLPTKERFADSSFSLVIQMTLI